jgi:hypothetical protein
LLFVIFYISVDDKILYLCDLKIFIKNTKLKRILSV